eukprot:jgi/Picsp_1/5053/NSC_02416-R1_nudix hydrolase 15
MHLPREEHVDSANGVDGVDIEFDQVVANIINRLGNYADRYDEPVSHKHASVLCPIFKSSSGEIRVLLTQRSTKLKSHPGEVCFPGGKYDEAQDKDYVATALRETYEEIGIKAEMVKVVAVLQPLLSKHLYSVTTVIGIISNEVVCRPNEEEVSCIFSVPLALFLEQEWPGCKFWSMNGEWESLRYTTHCWKLALDHNSDDLMMNMRHRRVTRSGKGREGEQGLQQTLTIWGLTASICTIVAQIGFDKSPNFDVCPKGSIAVTDIVCKGGKPAHGYRSV